MNWPKPPWPMRAVMGTRATVETVSDFDLDRVPDPDGEVRVVVTAEELERLKERGFEVRVVQDLPVKPLDPSLIEDDESVRAWIEERLAGIERREDT